MAKQHELGPAGLPLAPVGHQMEPGSGESCSEGKRREGVSVGWIRAMGLQILFLVRAKEQQKNLWESVKL